MISEKKVSCRLSLRTEKKYRSRRIIILRKNLTPLYVEKKISNSRGLEKKNFMDF